MSTRCQIGFYSKKNVPIENFSILLYRHSDGYPEDVLDDIIPFLKWWKKNRGISDIEYCSARTLQYLCNTYDKNYKTNKKDKTGIVGYGISNKLHTDIEYFYYIYPDTVLVYECKTLIPGGWKLIKTIEIK